MTGLDKTLFRRSCQCRSCENWAVLFICKLNFRLLSTAVCNIDIAANFILTVIAFPMFLRFTFVPQPKKILGELHKTSRTAFTMSTISILSRQFQGRNLKIWPLLRFNRVVSQTFTRCTINILISSLWKTICLY